MNMERKIEEWKRMLKQMVERIDWDVEMLEEGGDKKRAKKER